MSHLHIVETNGTQYDDLAHDISLLHYNNGKHPDAAIMAADPFFALYDIFHFVAASYRQYLNMLERKEDQRTLVTLTDGDDPFDDSNHRPGHWNSVNLRYDQAALKI